MSKAFKLNMNCPPVLALFISYVRVFACARVIAVHYNIVWIRLFESICILMSHYFLSLRSTFCFIGLIHIVMCHNTSEEFVPVCIFNAFYGAQCTKTIWARGSVTCETWTNRAMFEWASLFFQALLEKEMKTMHKGSPFTPVLNNALRAV